MPRDLVDDLRDYRALMFADFVMIDLDMNLTRYVKDLKKAELEIQWLRLGKYIEHRKTMGELDSVELLRGYADAALKYAQDAKLTDFKEFWEQCAEEAKEKMASILFP